MYDLIIIGGGPGGLAAAVYAARHKIKFCVITKDIGGQTLWSSDVENYLGFHLISGQQLTEKFEEHIKDYDIEIKEGESVNEIKKEDNGFKVVTDKSEYETKTVLIASGKKPRKLGVPGEEDFRGKGVTYCATCDGPLFKDKTVAVIGGGNSAIESAELLLKYARYIIIITNEEELRAEKTLAEEVTSNEKVEVHYNGTPTEILGDKFVNKIKAKIGEEEKEFDVEGVFVEIGSIPSVEFDKLTEKNDWNEIKIHQEGYISNKTSVEGIFAAGDCTDVPEKQIIVAAGEAVKAVLGVFKHLNQR